MRELHFDDGLQLKGCAFVGGVVVRMKRRKIMKYGRVWVMVILLCLLCFFVSVLGFA